MGILIARLLTHPPPPSNKIDTQAYHFSVPDLLCYQNMVGQRKRSRNMVGPQVRRLRSAVGLTQDDLAARCSIAGFDIGRASVSHIETGLRGVSDLEMVLLAKALRVPIADLVPEELPEWHKDLRPPTATDNE